MQIRLDADMMHGPARGRACFPTEKSILNALFRVIGKAGLKHCFWLGDLITFCLRFYFDTSSRKTSPGTTAVTVGSQSVYFGFVFFFRLSFPNYGGFITVVSVSKLEQT